MARCPKSHAAAAKKALIVTVPSVPERVPVRVPTQSPLAPSFTSVTSVVNDKGDNEMTPGLCTELLAFALWPRKTSENLS